MSIKRIIASWSFVTIVLAANNAQANVIYTVNLNTSAISGAAGYALAFQLADGSGVGDSNNSIMLSNFNFGGGSAGGCPVNCTLTGGASGDIASLVTLNDSDFFNSFAERFTPGTSLSFKLEMTTNVDAGGIPDAFGFSILDNNGTPLPTQDVLGADTLLSFDIDSANPTLNPFATVAGGPVALNAPTFALAPPSGNVPEPSSVPLMGAGIAGLVWAKRRIK